MLQLKIWSTRGASNHSAFMGKWPTFISLIHPEDELSIKEMRMWGQSKISSCCLCDWCVSREMGGKGESKITNTNRGKLLCSPSSRYKKVLDQVAFWIVYITWRVGYKIVAYNATSVGVGRRNRPFLHMCSRNCIIVVVIINTMYIVVVVECQDHQMNGPNKCKHEFSDSLHYSIFFILFCHKKLHTDPQVNKDFFQFLFKFFSKDSLSCSKVRVRHV